MSQMMEVTLPGPAPWGFRLAGGRDFNTPIHISKTTQNGKAAYEGLQVRDVVCAINGQLTANLTHFEAQDLIRDVRGDLQLRIRRGGAWVQSPTQSKAGLDFPSAPPPVRRAPEPEVLPPPGPQATIVHKQFNSPVGLYSADNIADAFKGQVEGMGINAGATRLPATPMSPMSPMSPGFGSPSGFGSPGATPFGSHPGTYEVLHSKPKPMAQTYTQAPRAQTYAPPRARPPVVRPQAQQHRPPPVKKAGPPPQAFSNPGAKSRSFRMLEEMTQEEEARAYEEMKSQSASMDNRSQTKSYDDDYPPYEGVSRGNQSRSFKMLQQLIAEDQEDFEDL